MRLDDIIIKSDIAATVVGPFIMGAAKGYAEGTGMPYTGTAHTFLTYAPTLIPAATMGFAAVALNKGTRGSADIDGGTFFSAGVGAFWGYSTSHIGYVIGAALAKW